MVAEKRITKAQAIAIRHAELGKCRAMLADKKVPRPCTNWALDEKGWCGQHYAAKVEDDIRVARAAARKAKTDAMIDEYLAANGQAAHVCGALCEFSVPIPVT